MGYVGQWLCGHCYRATKCQIEDTGYFGKYIGNGRPTFNQPKGYGWSFKPTTVQSKDYIFRRQQVFYNSWFYLSYFLFFTLFFKTKLGYLLKGIGDNENMITSLGIDVGKVKLLALFISNSFIGLSGGIMAQYQSFSDINMGRETMVMGLAAIIIGYNLFKGTSLNNFSIKCIIGTFIYRLSIAMSLRLGFEASDLRLISSTIVVIALVLGNSENILKDNKFLKRIDFTSFYLGKIGDKNA